MRALRALPLIALVIALYNVTVIAMFMPLDWIVWRMGLVSGAVWEMTLGDALVAFGIVLLFFEVLNAGSARAATLVNHTLSLGVFVFALVEFLLVPWCGTSTLLPPDAAGAGRCGVGLCGHDHGRPTRRRLRAVIPAR